MVTTLDERPRLDFGNDDTLYATHALHAFAAKCPPQLARWAIDRLTAPGDVVVDPMVGSGTTLVEAVLRGRVAIGCDVDPLARLIAKVKATPIPAEELAAASSALLAAFAVERVAEQTKPLDYPTLHRLDRWFLPSVARDLAILKRCIRAAEVGADVRDFLFVAFSSLITARTSVANARDLVHSRHHYREHASPPDVGVVLRRRLTQMRRQMAEFAAEREAAPLATAATVFADDARRLSLGDASVDLVFTSPPYCNALDYTRAHAFSVGWLADELGLSQAEYVRLGRRYIGSERAAPNADDIAPSNVAQVRDLVAQVTARDPRRGRILARYFDDMRQVLAEAARVLRPGGRLVLVVCPSHIRKVEVPTHEAFVAMGRDLGAPRRLACEAVEERILDDRRRLLPYMQEAFGRRMRTEYVVVLRKDDHPREPAHRPET